MAKGAYHQFNLSPPFISLSTCPHPKQAAPSEAIMMKIPPQVPSQPTSSGLPYAGADAAPPEGTTPKEHPPQKAPPKCALRVPLKAVQKAPPKAPPRHDDPIQTPKMANISGSSLNRWKSLEQTRSWHSPSHRLRQAIYAWDKPRSIGILTRSSC